MQRQVISGRLSHVSRLRVLCWLVGLTVIFGCAGGGGTRGLGAVSGNVVDLDGNPVRNAKVFALKKAANYTLSNSSGAFTLAKVEDGDQTIVAEIILNGTSYYGQTMTRIFSNEATKSLVLTVGRRADMARFKGVVADRFGDPVQGARVFANHSTMGSVMGITDREGKYEVFLHPGVDYVVSAGGLGFNSDTGTVRLNRAESRTYNFFLSNPSNIAFPPPANFSATAWTSPREVTRSPQDAQTYEAIKRAIDPRRQRRPQRTPLPRDTNGGNWIEVDLYWDQVVNDNLLGYGIYRGTSATGPTKAIEFLRDPLAAFFADADASLREGIAYYYEITALNTRYPDTQNSESDFSDRWGVRPLGDCTLRSVTSGSPVRFNWNATNGAEKYTVYVFDRYPNYGVSPFWPANEAQIPSATTTGTSLSYAGPAIGPGTYYYVVLAQDTRNGNDARSISRIGSFVVN